MAWKLTIRGKDYGKARAKTLTIPRIWWLVDELDDVKGSVSKELFDEKTFGPLPGSHAVVHMLWQKMSRKREDR